MSIGLTPVGAPRRSESWAHGSYSGRVGYVSVVAEIVIIPLRIGIHSNFNGVQVNRNQDSEVRILKPYVAAARSHALYRL